MRAGFVSGLGRALLAVAVVAGGSPAAAAPLRPVNDTEIVETLPAWGGAAAEQRRLRRQLARQPRDIDAALALSQSLLERARRDGDARLAGLALGALGAWDGDASAPVPVRLQRATLHQHLHDFDRATAELEAVLASAPRQPQVLLTLATVHRVQGHLTDSDRACGALIEAGQPLYAQACLAENRALRGDTEPARRALVRLLAAAPGQPGWAAWIHTTLGELEQRAGRPAAAIDHLLAALQAAPDPYARIAAIDALIEARRWTEADALLDAAGEGDAALLRRAIVARALRKTDASELRQRLAARYAQAALRVEAQFQHARERARFALEVEGDAAGAVVLARHNLKVQREAIDLVLLARAARAAADPAAAAEAVAIARKLGLHDTRIESANQGLR